MKQLSKLESFARKSSDLSGRFIAWLILALALIVVYDVSMRFLFREGSVALQELEWHLFALIFLIGAAYTYKHNAHVRIDVLNQRMSDKTRLWINILGDALFLIPFCLIIIQASWPFVLASFEMVEGSPDAGGLPYRYLIKAAIPVGFALLALQGLANLIGNIKGLSKNRAEQG